MGQKKTYHSNYYEPEKLQELERACLDHLDEIYAYFDCERYETNDMVKSCCFIHGGDNPTALNFYPNGDIRPHYKCRTHGCEDVFGKSLIHMVRGGLSRELYNWQKEGDKTATFREAVEFLLGITGQNFTTMAVASNETVEQRKFAMMVNNMFTEHEDNIICSLDDYKASTEIPSPYMLERFEKSTLEKFHVGYCDNPDKPMYQRSIVPVLDETCENVIGITGRSIFEECPKCGHYHDPNEACQWFPKWRHNKGFAKERYVYNLCRAKPYIMHQKFAILVESPGNVWRLDEIGVFNTLAIFGTSFNDQQKSLLDSSGAFGLLILTDNDEPGEKAKNKIIEQCKGLYQIYTPDILTENDIAGTNKGKLAEMLFPELMKIKEDLG